MNAGSPVSPLLKVPTEMPTIIMSPLGKSTVASAHADVSCSAPPEALPPHSASCQTTPASCPTSSLSQETNGTSGSFTSSLEAETRCATDSAFFSNDSDWITTLNHMHKVMTEIFIFPHAFP